MEPKERIIVALDRSDRDSILRLVDQLYGEVGMFKIGLQAFVANGPSIVEEVVSRSQKVFLDLKFHDIPNTAGNAVAAARQIGASMTTIHAAGGRAMVRRCVEAAGPDLLVLAVTVLTSLSDGDLAEIGHARGAEAAAVQLARLAQEEGGGGVVASPREVRAIREACGDSLVIVTPGIRGRADAAADQARTMAAAEAIAAGASYLVVGRPITEAEEPVAAARALVDAIGARGG